MGRIGTNPSLLVLIGACWSLGGCGTESATSSDVGSDARQPDAADLGGEMVPTDVADLTPVLPELVYAALADSHVLTAGALRLEIRREDGTFELFRGETSVLKSGAPASGEFAPIAVGEGEAILAASYVADGQVQADGSVVFPLSQSQMGPVMGTLAVASMGEQVLRLTVAGPQTPSGCGFSFSIPSAGHWYGQGELTRERNLRENQFHETSQFFPLDSGSYERPVLTSDEGTNVVSPMWLTQSGVVVFVDAYSFLNVSFNRDTNGLFKLHLIPREGEPSLSVDLLVADNTVNAYRRWVAFPFQVRPDLPVGSRPADELFTQPIWTTWAHYKSKIDQQKVTEFAQQISDRGFQASYVEIDDKWTPTYGDQIFDTVRFPEPKQMVDAIHQLGFRVSAWVPPFVNGDADAWDAGIEAKAFVASSDPEVEYPPKVGWWNSLGLPIAAVIDFSRAEGRDWWGEQVDQAAQLYDLDGFKFDAGETQFLPKPAAWGEGIYENAYPDYYAKWAMDHLGVEVRAAWFAQHLPISVRQFDKESSWGLDNGLASVLTQALAMGLIGYPFVLPDMVGGNEYEFQADEELFIRWMELNTWLPMVQFSLLPWRESFDASVSELTLAYMEFRKSLNEYLLELADEAGATQLPIARPLFFEFPEDPSCYAVGDQFMLGSRYMIAPGLAQGATARNIYLPSGSWQEVKMPSGEAGETLQGPTVLTDWPAPLESIPVFKRL